MKKRVIKFSADWCSPCKAYVPNFENVKNELSSESIEFVSYDVDNDYDETKKYQIRNVPTTIIENAETGEILERFTGVVTVNALKEKILN